MYSTVYVVFYTNGFYCNVTLCPLFVQVEKVPLQIEDEVGNDKVESNGVKN